MAQFSFRQALVTIIGAMTFGLASCDKGDPINPSGGGTKPDPVAKADTIKNYVLDIYAGESASFLGESILDGQIRYRGLNASVSDQSNSKVSTGASGYDNIKYKVRYFRDNLEKGTGSNIGGEYYIAAKNAKNPILEYEPATGKYLKVVSIADGNHTTVYEIAKTRIFAENKKGIRIMGSKYQNDTEFNSALDNISSPESSKICAESNFLDVSATKESILLSQAKAKQGLGL